jgi:hypothetical protein
MFMKTALVGLFISACAFGAADPQLVGLMMPDSKVLAGLKVADSEASPFGQFVLKQIPANSGLDNLVSATGFDPRQDLSEIVAASADAKGWLVAGRGTFQGTRIAGLAEIGGAKVTKYRGVDLIAAPANGASANNGTTPDRAKGRPNAASTAPENGVAFLDSSTVLIGDIQLVKAAIDRRAAGAVFNGPLAVKAQEASASNQAWAATITAVPDLAPALNGGQANNPMANVLQAITGLAVGVQLGSANVTLSGEAATRSVQDAQALADVLHFVVGMAQANRNNPQGGGAASLADAASISAQGASVRLSVTVPEQQLEQLFPSQQRAGVRKISQPAQPRR